MSLGSFFSGLESDGEKVIAGLGKAMRFAEGFFGSPASVQKLTTVESIVVTALGMVGVPAPLVQAGNAEFQAVVNAIVAWDKKLNGAILGSGSSAASSTTAPPAT